MLKHHLQYIVASIIMDNLLTVAGKVTWIRHTEKKILIMLQCLRPNINKFTAFPTARFLLLGYSNLSPTPYFHLYPVFFKYSICSRRYPKFVCNNEGNQWLPLSAGLQWLTESHSHPISTWSIFRSLKWSLSLKFSELNFAKHLGSDKFQSRPRFP